MPRIFILPDDQLFHSFETSLPIDELLARVRPETPVKRPPRKVKTLTARQRQVLQGLIDGQTTDQIAALLKISPRTVRLHLGLLKRLLQVETLAQLSARAAEMGLHSKIIP